MIRTVVRVLVIAGLVLPVASCSGAKPNPLLLGTWEFGEKSKRCSMEFTKDGKVELFGETSLLKDFQFVKLLAEYNMQPGMNMISYRPVSEKELEIEGDYSSLMEKLAAGGETVSREKIKEMGDMFHPKERVTYAVSEKELTLTGSQGKTITLKPVE